MTDDRTDDTPPPRPPLDVRTLVIASMASVIGALVVTRLGYAGKIAGAALAPIVVLLVTEFGHRSSAKIEQTAEKVAPVLIPPLRRHPWAPGGTEELPTIVLPPADEGPTMHLPPARRPGDPPVDRPPVAARSGSSPRRYTVHTGEQRARRSTRTRLVGILLAAACGVGVSVVAFTLLATASGGNVKLGSALQNSGGSSSKAKKTPATTTTNGSTQATTGSTSGSSTSTSTSTATSTVTSTVTSTASTTATTSAPTVSTTTAPASTATTTPAPGGSGPAPGTPTTAPPDTTPAASTAATTPASTPSTTGG